MNREQARNYLRSSGMSEEQIAEIESAFTCEDTVSRQAVEDAIYEYSRSCDVNYAQIMEYIDKIPSVNTEKTGQCKDCKWWKDSDGVYRRGIRAESRCPINTVSVANGVGYCYMFKPKMGVEE